MTTITAPSGRNVRWLICLLLAFAFGLADAAIVAWSARVLTTSEVFAGALTLGLVSMGLVVTVWKFDR
jgi:hypothetical protein